MDNAEPLAQFITADGDDAVEARQFLELPGQGTKETNDEWLKALEAVVPACVVLKVTQNRAFDTEAASSSYATGFVVDAERGLILTNRHVVTPGPVTAEAIFLNREELPVRPLYYDPVHDFGFFRFNPKGLQFMKAVEVDLAPEAAAVGLEVRVVGNDSGEKVSILAGTIARVDRDAPKYGKGYNDFNTFYLQAASGTKGGSSGSPVIDSKGRVVALNAGGKSKAASAYYLPLERVVRAFKILKPHYLLASQVEMVAGGRDGSVVKHVAAFPDGILSQTLNMPTLECYDATTGTWSAPHIPRGDLQTTFTFKGFDDVRRLGLQHATEAAVREACKSAGKGLSSGASVGMLVVESIVPGSPSDDILEPGDVLVRINGEIVTHFLPLEETLDRSVGQSVTVDIERNGEAKSLTLQVQDLDLVTPRSFLEFAGSCLHSLSYQQARNSRVPCGQVYVANEGGYMLSRAGVPEHAIITSLANQPTPDLISFARVLQQQPQGAQVPLQYYIFSDRHRRKNGLLHIDRTWYGPPVYWTRDDANGTWNCTPDWPLPSPVMATAPADTGAQPPNGIEGNAVSPVDAPDSLGQGEEVPGETAQADGDDLGAAYDDMMRRSMVLLDVDIPLVALADGVHSRCFAGNGVIVAHNEEGGLIVTDRNTVCVNTGDVMVAFGAYPAEAPAKILFLHPLYNYAILSYSCRDLPPEACKLLRAADCAADYIVGGEKVQLVGMTKQMRIMRREATVTHPCSSTSISAASVPRFRAVHEEVIKLDHDFGSNFSGVLANKQGQVRAIWASYSEQISREEREWCAGLPSALFMPWVERIKALPVDPATGSRPLPPDVPTLDAELEPIMMHKAQKYGLPADWIAARNRLDPQRRQVLRVRSRLAGSDASKQLRDGDLLLAINKVPVWGFRDIEAFVNGQMPTAGTKRAHSAAFPEGGAVQGPGPGPPDGRAGRASLALTIFRDHQITDVSVQLGQETSRGTEHMVHWCGAQLQAPHRAVRELGFVPEGMGGVFISRWHHGSPSHRYGLYALHWILELNGQPTPDLDTFVAIARTLEDRKFVRVKLCQLETTKCKVLALKQDLHFWPTYELRLDHRTSTWIRNVIKTGDGVTDPQ